MARKAKTFGSATPKKMATGGATKSGSSSASKSTAAKGAATPASKSGSSAAGKTMAVSAAQKSSALANARSALTGGSKFTTVTDPKTRMSYDKPSYRGMSVKGLTSSDPANVARNRAAAANYAAIEAARGPRSDSSERMMAPRGPSGPARNVAMTPAAPTMMYVPAPAGYRPGIDPEHRFYQPKPTVTLAKGGKVKPKRKK